MSATRYQAVVVGAGLVGTATALALARQGLLVALVERQPPAVPSEAWDTRIYAISPAHQRFLERLGAWQRMDASRVHRIREDMERAEATPANNIAPIIYRIIEIFDLIFEKKRHEYCGYIYLYQNK